MTTSGFLEIGSGFLEIVHDWAVDKTLSGCPTEFKYDASGIKAEEFSHTILIVKDGSRYYKATYYGVIFSQTYVRRDHLTDVEELDLEKLKFPIPKRKNLMICPPELAATAYIKKPKLKVLLNNESLQQVEELFVQEAEMAEYLSCHPNPHIATYHGIVIENEKFIGLVYKKYKAPTLDGFSEMPGWEETIAQGNNGQRITDDIVAGIKHLHSISVIYNDIKPDNIMLEKSRAVIIDFDSARKLNEAFGLKRGTKWFEKADALKSEEVNDWYVLKNTLLYLGLPMPSEEGLLESNGVGV